MRGLIRDYTCNKMNNRVLSEKQPLSGGTKVKAVLTGDPGGVLKATSYLQSYRGALQYEH